MNKLDAFDHVVVLVMENRSFDNMLGHLIYTGRLTSREARHLRA
jgi:phospholipase C